MGQGAAENASDQGFCRVEIGGEHGLSGSLFGAIHQWLRNANSLNDLRVAHVVHDAISPFLISVAAN